MVEAHVVRQEKDGASAQLASIAAVIKFPGVGVPVIEMAVFDRKDFAIHAVAAPSP